MAGTGAYRDVVGEMGGATPGPPAPPGAPPNVGSALGAPPPSMVGQMPTGGDALSPRAAASATIDQLAGLKSHYPSAADRIDGMIAEITGMAKTGPEASPGAKAPSPPKAIAPATLPPPPPLAMPPLAPPGPGLPFPAL